MSAPRSLRIVLLLVVAAFLVPAEPAHANATITIANVDGPGEGFNDPTPVAPVGGNPGTTLGQQRLIAFQFAADLWGMLIDSDVEIVVQASFDPLPCTATGAVLGAAGAIQIFANFPGAEFQNTWYHVALANKLAGFDLAPGPLGTSADDLVAFFNVNLGLPGCLTGRGFYLGLDTNHGSQINLVTVLLHEFAHGLGFSNFVNEATGTQPLGLPDVYSIYTFDKTAGLNWTQMDNAQRVTSAINSRNVIWTGNGVTKFAPNFLQLGVPLLRVNSPPSIAGDYQVGTAAFGPPLTAAGITGDVVLADDGVGATADACEPIVNAPAIAGNIALVDRGTCTFTTKVANAQAAGATAVIVADNVAGSPPPGLGGADPTIVIPSVRITLNDGNTIKSVLGGGVNATLGLDLSQLSGADSSGRLFLNAPNPVQLGSSISHWDPIAFPNLLMEPAINADLPLGVDLSLPLFWDIGWLQKDDCKDGGWRRFPGFFPNQGQCVAFVESQGVPSGTR